MNFDELCSINDKNKITVERISKQLNAVYLTDGRTVSPEQIMGFYGYLTNPSTMYAFGADIEKELRAGLFDKRSFLVDKISTNNKGETVVNIEIVAKKNIKATLTVEELINAICVKRKYLSNTAALRPLFEKRQKEEAESGVDEQLRLCVISMLKHCKETQHIEMPVKIEEDPEKRNVMRFYANVTQDFKRKLTKEGEAPCDVLRSTIEIRKDNTLEISVTGKNRRKELYRFIVPFKNASDNTKFDAAYTIDFIKKNYTIFMGMCGYVAQQNIQTAFANLAPFTHEDYQGIRDYTMTSGATNRYCRGIPMDAGEEVAGALRNIRRCDSYFNKTVLARPVTVFRGEKCEEDSFLYKKMLEQNKGYTNVAGFVAWDSAYTSTSLNMLASLYFAGVGGKRGIVYVMDLPAGLRAGYTHNVAGWVEQFEITVDRVTDIVVDESILKFKDCDGVTYNIVRAHVNIHQPCTPIQSPQFIKRGKLNYDEYGRVPFNEEYADNMMHEAYQLLTNKGVDVQYQKEGKMHMIDTNKYYNYPSMVVARTKNVDTEEVTDLGFSLGENGLEVRKIGTKVKACARQDYGKAKGLHWQEYGLGYSFVDNGYDSNVESNIDLDALYKCRVLHIDGEISAKTIAKRIYDYLQYQKNVAMFPILDIARYFDMCMAQIITSEGYELKNSIRVERKVDPAHEGDSQAGYVPCQYTINGDKDDHLTIRIKFERERQTGKLCVTYRGRSDKVAMSETKRMTFNVFNNDKMVNLAILILYEFERKMQLSRARKIDCLLQYFCSQTGCTAVKDLSELGKQVNGHRINKDAEGNVRLDGSNYSNAGGLNAAKAYKVWNISRTEYFNITAFKQDSEKFVLHATAINNRTKDKVLDNSIEIDTSYPMSQCYKMLVNGLTHDTAVVKYDEL